MATCIVLGHFTDQGIRNVKDTTKRADAAKQMAKETGATLKELYWTLGQYDVVGIIEAPDDKSIIAFALGWAKLGNLRTQTMHALTQAEMGAVLDKVK
jgi:uncharacterized protein with GYD domain